MWFLDFLRVPTCGDPILAEFATPASVLRAAQIQEAASQLCVGILSGSDITSKLDMFQVYAAETEQQAKLDWITLAEEVTYASAPVFNMNAGYETDGTDDAVLTGFNPGDGGSYNFAQNSASIGIWRVNPDQVDASSGLEFDGTDGNSLAARQVADTFRFRVNQATATRAGFQASGSGLAVAVRTGSAATAGYKDGRLLASDESPDQTSTAVNNAEFRVGSLSGSIFASGVYGAAFAGGALTNEEVCDIHNALAGYFVGTELSETISVDLFDLHVVRNGWAPNGNHIVCVAPDKVYRSTDNGQTYQLVFTLPDNPERLYGFFIAENGNIFVSGEYQTSGIDGRTYRSTDGGDTFTQITTFDASFRSGNIAFWSMCEDTTNGDLYVGQYNVDNPKLQACKVFKSTDDGANWTDISDASWSTTDHVHAVAIDPKNGWLYANIGDSTGGLWRSKLKDGSDWVAKTDTSGLYIPIVFDDTYVYTADDMQLGVVVRFEDDGGSSTQALTTVLDDPDTHNVYYMARDNSGRFWVSMPPADASLPSITTGVVYISDDGTTWHRIFAMPQVAYSTWFTGDDSGDNSSQWQLHSGTTHFRSSNENLFTGYSQNGLTISTEFFHSVLLGDELILSGDANAGSDNILLSGDMQSGTDVLLPSTTSGV